MTARKPKTTEQAEPEQVDPPVEAEQEPDAPAEDVTPDTEADDEPPAFPLGGPTHTDPQGNPVRVNDGLHDYVEARGYTRL